MSIKILLCFLAAHISYFSATQAYAQAAKPDSHRTSFEMLPLEISPEGVQALSKANIPFILINAEENNNNNKQPDAGIGSHIRRIYYTTGLSSRLAQNLITQDRNKVQPAAISDTLKLSSQRLTGTPIEWQRIGLKFNQSPLPSKPLLVSPKQLAEAIKDNVDLQVIDLNPALPNAKTTSFPQALHVLPHELDTELTKLSKQRWVILIDGGNRVAQPISERLFQQGYKLITILEGGYPAWVRATDR